MSCPKKEVELILWCRNWVAVYKREKFLSDWTYDSSSDEYSDWLWSLWRTPWECQAAISQKDPEIVCMTNDGGETIIKWVVIFSYDGTTWTSTINNLDGSVATGYTVIPCATSNRVEEWEVRCDGGINIIPFYDVETDWAASANVAFWFNPVTNSVVTPSGNQTPWACTASTIPFNKVIDWSLLTSVVWWTTTYTFTFPVTDIDIYNDTDWYASITYNNSIPTVWNNLHPIAPWQSISFNAKSWDLINSVTLTDINQSIWWVYAIKWVRL